MKKTIHVYPIKSILSNGGLISAQSQKLIDELSILLDGYEFKAIGSFSSIKDDDFVLILVQSGGSEGIFKNEVYPNYEGPYYLLTYGSSNSLAASLEILSFIKRNKGRGEILHGNDEYIASRIKELSSRIVLNQTKRLGVIGEPSDWLISSDVDEGSCLKIFGYELIKIPQEEVIGEINRINVEEMDPSRFDYDQTEIKKALRIYEALKIIINRYDLAGFTIRCFDIIKEIKSSACLALALFNEDDIIASCEGDIPSMISAQVALELLGVHSFQCNPQWVDPVNNELYMAHCTLPLDMAKSYALDTHFESGIGVGIHGDMEEGPVTIFKISAELNEFYCEEGNIILNEYRKDRCRTQIKIKMNSPSSYFLNSSLGNHHQIIYGHHASELRGHLIKMGLREIK